MKGWQRWQRSAGFYDLAKIRKNLRVLLRSLSFSLMIFRTSYNFMKICLSATNFFSDAYSQSHTCKSYCSKRFLTLYENSWIFMNLSGYRSMSISIDRFVIHSIESRAHRVCDFLNVFSSCRFQPVHVLLRDPLRATSGPKSDQSHDSENWNLYHHVKKTF